MAFVNRNALHIVGAPQCTHAAGTSVRLGCAEVGGSQVIETSIVPVARACGFDPDFVEFAEETDVASSQ